MSMQADFSKGLSKFHAVSVAAALAAGSCCKALHIGPIHQIKQAAADVCAKSKRCSWKL